MLQVCLVGACLALSGAIGRLLVQGRILPPAAAVLLLLLATLVWKPIFTYPTYPICSFWLGLEHK